MKDFKLYAQATWITSDESDLSFSITARWPYYLEEDTRIGIARRIAACVNACSGIPTDILESSAVNMLELSAARANSTMWHGEAVKAKQQRDELLAALEEMAAIVRKHTYPQPDKPNSTWGRLEAAEQVIARVKGGAA